MGIELIGRQVEITSDIREFVDNHVSNLVEDPFYKISSSSVVIERDNNMFQVKIVINCKCHVVTGKSSDYDVFKAIAAAADKVESQLSELRGKIIGKRPSSGK